MRTHSHNSISAPRPTAVLLSVLILCGIFLSACTQQLPSPDLSWKYVHSGLCENQTRQQWSTSGIGKIAKIDCLEINISSADSSITSGNHQMTPTIVYFTKTWNQSTAKECFTGAARILSQCGIRVPKGKLIGVKSSHYGDISSRSKLAVLRSRIDDPDFSVFPTFLVDSSYMEQMLTADGEEEPVNGFVTRGGDNSNNAVIINPSVGSGSKNCGIVTAHEWVHFIRDWPDKRYPGHDISGHHQSEGNLLYKSLAASSLTKQQCAQIIENGVSKGIIQRQ